MLPAVMIITDYQRSNTNKTISTKFRRKTDRLQKYLTYNEARRKLHVRIQFLRTLVIAISISYIVLAKQNGLITGWRFNLHSKWAIQLDTWKLSTVKCSACGRRRMVLSVRICAAGTTSPLPRQLSYVNCNMGLIARLCNVY